jgi:hypothetical protein
MNTNNSDRVYKKEMEKLLIQYGTRACCGHNPDTAHKDQTIERPPGHANGSYGDASRRAIMLAERKSPGSKRLCEGGCKMTVIHPCDSNQHDDARYDFLMEETYSCTKTIRCNAFPQILKRRKNYWTSKTSTTHQISFVLLRRIWLSQGSAMERIDTLIVTLIQGCEKVLMEKCRLNLENDWTLETSNVTMDLFEQSWRISYRRLVVSRIHVGPRTGDIGFGATEKGCKRSVEEKSPFQRVRG